MSIKSGSAIIPQIKLGVINLNKIMLGVIEIFPNLAPVVPLTPISIFSLQPLAVDNVTTASIPLNTTGLLVGDTVFVIRRSTVSAGVPEPTLALNSVPFVSRLSQVTQATNGVLSIDSYVVLAGVPNTGVVNIVSSYSTQLRADIVVARGGSASGLNEMIGSATAFGAPGPLVVSPTETDREALFIGAGVTAAAGTISSFTVTEPTDFTFGTPRVALTGLGCIVGAPQPVTIEQLPTLAQTTLGGIWMRGFATAPPAWTIYSPFTDGSGGSAFDIGINGTLFQDNTGVIPVTASGQPVGMFVGRRSDTPLPARVNLAQWTEDFTRVVGSQGANTSTNAAVLTPDGAVGGVRLNENAASSMKSWAWLNWAPQSGNVYTCSVYAKYVDRQWLQINMSDGAAWANATFDILNGVTGQQAGSVTGLAIEDAGNGWWRCSMTRTTGGSAGGLGLGVGTDGSINQAYQGVTNMGAIVWGMQVDIGSTPLAYQRINSPNGSWLPSDLLVLYAPNTANRPLYTVESGVERIRFDGINNQFVCDTNLPWLEFSLINGQSFPEGQTATRTWWNNGQSPAGWQSWYRNTPTVTNFINITSGNAGPTFPAPLEFVAWLRQDGAVLRAQINDRTEYTRASVGYVPRTGVGFNVGSGNGTTFYIGDWIVGGALVGKALDQSDIDNYKSWLYTNGGITP